MLTFENKNGFVELVPFNIKGMRNEMDSFLKDR